MPVAKRKIFRVCLALVVVGVLHALAWHLGSREGIVDVRAEGPDEEGPLATDLMPAKAPASSDPLIPPYPAAETAPLQFAQALRIQGEPTLVYYFNTRDRGEHVLEHYERIFIERGYYVHRGMLAAAPYLYYFAEEGPFRYILTAMDVGMGTTIFFARVNPKAIMEKNAEEDDFPLPKAAAAPMVVDMELGGARRRFAQVIMASAWEDFERRLADEGWRKQAAPASSYSYLLGARTLDVRLERRAPSKTLAFLTLSTPSKHVAPR